MPVISTFIQDDGMRMSVTVDDMMSEFKDFYSRDGNRVDIDVSKSRKPIEKMTDSDWKRLILDNPVHFLTKTESKFFSFDGKTLTLDKSLKEFHELTFFISEIKDVIECRVLIFKRDRYSDE